MLTFLLIVKIAAIKTPTACLKLRPVVLLHVRSVYLILVFITFGSFVVCFDVSPLIEQNQSLKKLYLLEILKSKPEVMFVLPHIT